MLEMEFRVKTDGQAVKRPTVSVIIPAYNAAQYVGEALDSVFAQTFADYEVILINDGSPDTDELERVLAPYIERITYLKQENRGPSGARNAAILKSRSEYVALLDSDDKWMNNYLARQMKAIKDSSIDMIYSDALLIGNSALAGKSFMQTAPSRGPVTFESLLKYESSIITSCVVARRQCLVDAGLFDERFIRCEDFDLWIRLAHRGSKLGYQCQVLAYHRLNEKGLAASSKLMVESQMEVLKKSMRTLPLSLEERQLVTKQLVNCEAQIDLDDGKRHFVMGQYKEAADAVRRANEFYQSPKLWLVLFVLRAAPGLLRTLYNVRHKLLARKATASVS